MKRAISILFALLIIAVCVIPAAAVDYGCNVDTVSGAIYLENLDTGAVVYEKNSTTQMYPASTTKIMTYVITAENVTDFDNTMVEIKEDVITGLDPESTVMGLSSHIGEQVSVRDLLYGLMLPSGNDAALVLADYVGNGIPHFVEMMNAKAAELGCTGTHFMNPHGLYDADHYTTAHDMALIAKHARTLNSFMEITSTVYYTPSGFDTLHNTNYMLDQSFEGGAYYYPYTKGIKTGYLDEAGKCLVTTAEKDGFTYLCVCLGANYSYAEDVNYAMKDTANLYNWAYENLGTQTVYGPSDTVTTVPVKYVWGDKTVTAVPEKEVFALLPNSFNKDLIVVDINCKDVVEAPVKKGDVLGTVSVRYDDMDLGTTNVVAAQDIERDGLNYTLSKIGEFIKTHIVLVLIIVVVLILLIILLVAASSARRRRKARAARARNRGAAGRHSR